MRLLARQPYICRGCTHILRNGFSRQLSSKALFKLSYRSASTVPLRLAIIGSGPAGFYSALRVMQKLPTAVVDMYEQLPIPFGLVRYGVAPDHPEVKNCQDRFEEVAESNNFKFIGNTKIGVDVSLSALAQHYDAILFAYGASKDKMLNDSPQEGILFGEYSARAFVGWYNGLPEFADLNPNLGAGKEAVVIGQGNVALDVARILLSDWKSLRSTDISESALEILAKSKVKKVTVVGRRGPLQAAFTIKELRELLTLPDVSFSPVPSHLLPPPGAVLTRPQKRITDLLAKGSTTPQTSASKHWELSFFLEPKSFDHDGPSLNGIKFQRTHLAPGASLTDKYARVESEPGSSLFIQTRLAFKSIGYQSDALPGLSDLGITFDEQKSIIPNDMTGRVLSQARGSTGEELASTAVPGCYVAGWVKRGPTGVIASTMEDAFATADVIASDWDKGFPFLKSNNGLKMGWEGVKREALNQGARPVSWDNWKIIDAYERAKGKEKGKPREKLLRVEEMLKILDG